ncbi:hypothetical protein AOQ84DRAFT_136267 [Glonium stellatum]|uniref:Uncharacterized protein n=1 Tax=Glonium stellatum TaxID=574774 RepID=A0A8E2ES61_9PEZI|nr:hypothetical protein AOQ84DRAFT_136267 [Glonium stellatum]
MVLCFFFLRAFWLDDPFLAETGTVLLHPGWRSANGVVVFLHSMIMLSLTLGGLRMIVFWCGRVQKSTVVTRQGFAINQSLTLDAFNQVRILWPQ